MLLVNDRGPTQPRRIVDVSRAMAQRLGFVRSGPTEVQLEVVEAAKRRPAKGTSSVPSAREIMGLLDELLGGGALGESSGREGGAQRPMPQSAATGSAMGNIVTALLPVGASGT